MEAIKSWFIDHSGVITRVCSLIFIGWPILFLINRFIRNNLKRHWTPQVIMLVTRMIMYIGSAVIVMMVLKELKYDMSAILGAAGVAGVAIGFASQTSLSNLISGLFLLWEKPFQLGDVISVGEHKGVVESMELLSVNLRSFDNLLIRIPNETLVKASFVNITRYPIRRFDINVGVAYKEDIGKVMKILKELADKNPYCLDEPEPVVVFKGFGASSLDFLFAVWFAKDDFAKVRNSIQKELKDAFDREGIEIPFPHLTVYTGSATDPFPISLQKE